jgi:hypothetical protein
MSGRLEELTLVLPKLRERISVSKRAREITIYKDWKEKYR